MPAGDRRGSRDSEAALGDGSDPPVSAATTVSRLECTGIRAEAARLVGVRRTLHDWASAAGLPQSTVYDLVLASYEAMANSVEHGYRNGPGTIDVRATCDEDEVVVTVRDRGEWRPPPTDPGRRGRGCAGPAP